MQIEELVAALVSVPSDSSDPAIDWNERSQFWSELAAKADGLITSILPPAFCTAREWDNRIDCAVKQADGMIVGEMISLEELSAERLQETAKRLRRKLGGEHVQLVGEIRPPLYIGGPL